MENKYIFKLLTKTILIIGVPLFGGILCGAGLEWFMPSEFCFTYLTQEEIYRNNQELLIKAILYGVVSFGLYSGYFIFTFGNIVGQALVLLYFNYGIEGIQAGFLPHAGIELISCIMSSIVPIFLWLLIFDTFIRKTELLRKKVVMRGMVILLLCIITMIALCYGAAYIESNITEMYWLEKL